MFRSAVILTGVLACEVGLSSLLADAMAGPAVSERPVGPDPGTGTGPGTLAADRFVRIAVPWSDCECRQSPFAIPPPTRVRTVRLVDSAGLAPDTQQAIADEIIRFMGGRRIEVDKSMQAEADPVGDAGPVYVLLRHGGAPTPAGKPRARAGRPDDAPLAWVLFQPNQPTSHVFVWVGAVQRLLDGSSIEGRPFTHWHAELRRALLARAIGRVAAHEIGHLTCGPSHAPGGLMRRRFTTDDLLWKTTPLAPNGKHRACREAAPH